MPINDLETRTLEVGRIRLGAKSDRGAPIRLDAFRLTSQDELALKVAAELWGGTVQPWTSAPDAGTFEVYTEATTLTRDVGGQAGTGEFTDAIIAAIKSQP